MRPNVEIWMPVPSKDGIIVSNLGRVMSVSRGVIRKGYCKYIKKEKIISQFMMPNGYMRITHSYNGKKHGYYVHRLIAEAFLPNPLNRPCVNHKDENRHNNSVENLEWCTYEYNNRYGNIRAKIRESIGARKVVCKDKDGNLVKVYVSTGEAKNEGFCPQNIRRCAKGIIKTHKGYKWEYLD